MTFRTRTFLGIFLASAIALGVSTVLVEQSLRRFQYDDIRASLSARTDALGREIEALRRDLARQPARLALLPDLEIFHKAVDWALRYNEFFKTNEFSAPEGSSAAQRLLDEGARRATALRGEPTPYWTEARGPVVRGYRSRLDGSVQPYGLVVPDTFQPAARQPYRLDFWFHGRGETLSELAFLDERMRRRVAQFRIVFEHI